jgi:hypothetical protein
VAKAKDKGALKLVTAEAQDVEKKFRELYERANKRTAGAGIAAERLRELMSDNAGAKLWQRIAGPMSVAESFAVEHTAGATPGVRECWRAQLKDIRDELAGDKPSEVEYLLAHHAALCWLRLAETEILYTSKLSTPQTLAVGVYFEKRLTAAQRRFTRACETLERVRMMRRRAALPVASAQAEQKRA